MDAQTRAKYESQSQDLRVDLKTWENNWAKSHHGKKPSRDDIKQNPDIAHKYKQYSKVRDVLAGKVSPDNLDRPREERKRKQPESSTIPPSTPSKRSKVFHTPSKSHSQSLPSRSPAPSAGLATPSISRTLFSPVVPTSIGPTPQKDGRVLGLFDLLAGTPSRTKDTHPPLSATPRSKKRDHDTASTPGRHGRTPATPGRFVHIQGLTTPLHERHRNAVGKRTPSSSRSVSKLQFGTPAFLRRTTAPLPPVDENGEWKVGPLRLPKKPIARSLSSIVAGLRKIEDEALDEELDVLREMEMEAAGMAPPPKKATPAPPVEGEEAAADDGAEVEDSQVKEPELPRPDRPVLLGGFDDENAYDSSADEQLDRGQPLRVYKKKGQKRTTRRSYLKPTRTKRPLTAAGEEEDEDEDGVVLETQFDATKAAAGGGEELGDGLLSGSDFDEDESDDDGAEKKKAKAKKDKKAKEKKDKEKAKAKGKEKDKGKGEEKEEGTVKKAVRKVKATAHANFKRLKLRQGGAKGGAAHNSRFRRRR
ncbi:putative dna replication regulator sld2 protein [Podospora conica]|nr:putative dna replication regulator sld2 protein [Schizothecium conicum]